MSVDMREPFAKDIFSPYLLMFAAFLAYGMAAAYLLFKRGRLGLLGFALLFPWLMFMTELSTVRIQEPFVLYRSYLWSVGAFALLPLIFWKITARGATLMLAIIAAFLFPISMERLSTFSHPVLLWDDAEKLVRDRAGLPGVFRIYYNRGTSYLHIERQYDAAISDLKRSLELYSGQPYAYHNLGVAYRQKGELEEAVKYFSMAIQTNNDVKHYLGRADVYEAQGNWIAASNDYKISCMFAGKGCEKINLTEKSRSVQTAPESP
jgi:tetratricopeptide (TPR) repeat protein